MSSCNDDDDDVIAVTLDQLGPGPPQHSAPSSALHSPLASHSISLSTHTRCMLIGLN